MKKSTPYKIVDPIQIVVNNCYKIEVWEKEILKRGLLDNPNATGKELCDMFGISERTLYRKVREHGLVTNLKEKSN